MIDPDATTYLKYRREKVNDITFVINNSTFLHDKYILVQKGKKNYYLVKAV